jgi:hypothetical protein
MLLSITDYNFSGFNWNLEEIKIMDEEKMTKTRRERSLVKCRLLKNVNLLTISICQDRKNIFFENFSILKARYFLSSSFVRQKE